MSISVSNGYDGHVVECTTISGSMPLLRILLANPHPIVRSNLRLLLERDASLHVVAEAANGREAVVLADYRHPDIVLLDINLPQVNGIAAAREILAKNSDAAIVFVTSHSEEAYVSEALKAGARGYVLEDAAETDLVPAIATAGAGGTFISPRIGLSTKELAHAADAQSGLPPSAQ
jgi:two-component system response regulator DegU